MVDLKVNEKLEGSGLIVPRVKSPQKDVSDDLVSTDSDESNDAAHEANHDKPVRSGS